MLSDEIPYVDLHEAVRIVVRLMPPDGELLADKITDDFFMAGFREWNADKNPDDDPLLTQAFGPDWRTVRPKVFAAYWRAIRLLEKVLSSGRVTGKGVSVAAREKGPQLIEPDEWASRWLDIRRNRLTTPAGIEPELRPPILDVLVSREDLERESAAEIASENQSPPAPDLKSVLRDLLRDDPNLAQTAAFKLARDRGAIFDRQDLRDLWTTVGGSTKPGPRGPRKNRAKLSA